MSRDRMIRWALMGEHSLIEPLVNRLLIDEHMTFVRGVRTPRLRQRVGDKAAGATYSDRWDALAEDDSLDFVVVASDETEMLDGAKLLAQMGRTLVVLPLAEHGTSWIHEMSLVRDDGTAKLVAVWPMRGHPGTLWLKELIGRDEVGRVLEVQFQRDVQKPSLQGTPGLIPPRELDDLFLHDADAICQLIGEPTHLTAVTLGHVEGAVSRALTTIATSQASEASWSVNTGEVPDAWQIVVRGETGTIVLKADSVTRSALLVSGEDESKFSAQQIDDAVGESLKDAVLREALGRPFETASPVTLDDVSSWGKTLRNYEMLDASHRSRRRRRTIDLLGETPSERSQFKAQMAAVGCGLLMVTLFGVVGLLLLGAFVDAPSPHVKLAEQHNTLFHEHEFVEGTDQLTPAGEVHLDHVVPQLRGQRCPVVIEVDQDGGANRALNELRRTEFIERLEVADVPNPENRVFLEPVKSPWLRTLLAWGRVLVFLPLFLFLALQGLFILTRPSAEQKS